MKNKLFLVIILFFFLISISRDSSFATTCSISNPSVCNDNDACTEDVCTAGLCRNQPKSCSDNNACTTDSCSNGECLTTPKVCDDGNPNTTDTCNMTTGCVFTCITGTTCNDGNLCTEEDICSTSHVCIGMNKLCNDQNSETTDTCSLTTGECIFTPFTCPSGNSCDDGNLCTINDQCSNNECKGTTKTCNDENSQTVDTCNASTGECTFMVIATTCSVSNPSVCNDGDACTVDVCSAGLCIHQPKSCSDSNACTTDSCNNGQCLTTPKVCDDGNPNTSDTCNMATGCVFTCISGTPCDDGYICTIEDKCSSLGLDPQTGLAKLQCLGGKSKCNDEDPNTFDTCNGTTGECTFVPLICPGTSSCDDRDLCTLNDKCSLNECKGTKKTCDDGSFQTIDICNSATGECSNTQIRQGSNKGCMVANGAADCNDNNLCTLDICQADRCFYDAKHESPCDDENPCTVSDACFINLCTGTPKICDDGNTNTADSCNATTGECIFTPIVCQEGSSCDDSNLCTINDLCSNSLCAGTPTICDDQNINTADSCNATTGECIFIPIVCQEGGPCDDSNLCTINDLCSNSLCAGTPKICDDQNANTRDECTQSTGECLNTPISTTGNNNNSSCPNNCSKPNGRCNKKTNTCICKFSFVGEDCSKRECPKDCSGNGTCENKTGRCLCNPGFIGKTCSIQRVACANALGCGKKQVCEKGRCLLISDDRLDCINSNECSNNELCDAGYCVKNLSFAIKCLNSSKCKSTEICDKGFCVVPSSALSEEPCLTAEDCFAENEICDNGFCVVPPK